MMTVADEMPATEAVDLDRRDGLTVPLGQCQPLPAEPRLAGGGPEAPVEVAPGAGGAGDRVQPDGLQPQLALTAPAERADDLVERHEAAAVSGPAAQAVRQRGQELAAPGPEEVIFRVCLGESRIQHGSAFIFAAPPAFQPAACAGPVAVLPYTGSP